MLLRMPDYYKTFHCVANECKHNCCATNWEIDVDEKTYQHYCQLETKFGERLRASIRKDKHIHFKLKHGKCPFLTKGHLCEVYQRLGEKLLCKVCTQYPRVKEKYGDVQENTLALSCEEVGRILFSHPEPVHFTERVVEEPVDMKKVNEEKLARFDRHPIEKARHKGIMILQNRKLPLKERLYYFLLYCNEIQHCLDENQIDRLVQVAKGFEISDASKGPSRQKISEVPVHTLFQKRMEIIMDMEVVEEEWGEAMNNVMRAFYADSQKAQYAKMAIQLEQIYPQTCYQYEHLMVYFAYQYLMQAIYDGDFLNPAKFSVISYLTIRDMDMMKCLIQGGQFSLEDRIEDVRLFCKQVQHSGQSEHYLRKQIATQPVFSLEALLKQVNSSEA